jgi:hypothetical protein
VRDFQEKHLRTNQIQEIGEYSFFNGNLCTTEKFSSMFSIKGDVLQMTYERAPAILPSIEWSDNSNTPYFLANNNNNKNNKNNKNNNLLQGMSF